MVVRAYGADDDDLSGTPYPPDTTGRFNIESGTGGGTTSAGAADAAQELRLAPRALRPFSWLVDFSESSGERRQ